MSLSLLPLFLDLDNMAKCGACNASTQDCHTLFACTTCADPHFLLCASCEPMSMTYHHWRHSFLLIENYDIQKQTKAPHFIANLITNNKLNGKLTDFTSEIWLPAAHQAFEGPKKYKLLTASNF